MVRAKMIAEVLGGRSVLRKCVSSIEELDAAVTFGLPKKSLRLTVERVALPGDIRQTMARIVPAATFKRRQRLSPAESAKTERLARVIASAEHTWNDKADARQWMTKAHPELGNKTPLDTSMSELGARRVEALLEKLFYGIPA